MDQLTLLSEALPASRSASQESERDSRESQVSCSSTFEQFERSVLAGLSGRTSRERSQARRGLLSDSSCQKWMTSGTVWHGVYSTRSSSEWHSGDGCLTPWDTQSSRIYSQDGVWPTLYAGSDTSGLQRQSVLAYGFCAGNSAKAGSIGFQPEQSPTLRAGESGTNMVPTIIIDRAAFNQGANAQYDPHIEATDLMDTPVARGPHAVCTFHQNQEGDVHLTEDMAGTITAGSSVSRQQIVCMASGQANAEIEYDMTPAQAARQYKYPPIICVADDNANAAIDDNLCGSLKVGGGQPYVAYRATGRTLSAHCAPETSRESEASTSTRGR